MKRNVNVYTSREDKPEYLLKIFPDLFLSSDSLLDVGCDKKQLKKILLPKTSYAGIDITGMPDIIFDLDSGKSLPFEDKKFDLVFCSEVLEHLENIHFIFDELCRVSNKYVLISLPNAMTGISAYLRGNIYSDTLEKNKMFGKYIKFYGLPLDKPLDRHRWFFNTEEALEFVRYRAEKNDCKIEQILYSADLSDIQPSISQKILTWFNRKKLLNSFNHMTWFLIKKG
ncbi:MAG: methyltransferase domain-containing protein [Candidatus Gorgyraea atricola]|nr:methyltransferase domain-containing protein [Candidatus Gorgyraea atricola]